MPAPAKEPARRGAGEKQQNEKEQIATAVRVRPEIRAVTRVRTEHGYPYAEADKLERLRLEERQRAAIECLTDSSEAIHECSLPVPTAAKLAVLMCRHDRLGGHCTAESMALVPEELWLRIFHLARTVKCFPNAVELGPPPGSYATSGVLNAPTPLPDGEGAPELDTRRFGCTLAFDSHASQLELYESVGAELLDSALAGHHAAILAYGPRGSGKRYTIEGGASAAARPDEARAAEGLLQRAVRHACLEASRRPSGLHLRLSCYAIHRRQAYDLLAADAPAKRTLKRQDANGERVPAFVDGLRAPAVRDVEEGLRLIEAARAARTRLPVCESCANWTLELDTIWSLHLAAPSAADGARGGVARTEASAPAAAPPTAAMTPAPPTRQWLGSLSLVNLAAHGRRYHCEACMAQPAGGAVSVPPSIGNGVSSLSLVIGQLADGKSRYISYRDSPTTELLQEALGGRAKATWIAHLIPACDSMDYEHNRSSLGMARRVHQIRNRPQRASHEPLGLAPEEEEEEEVAEAVAEEREIAELQKLLTSGPCSKRAAAPSSKRAPLVDV